MYVSAHVCLYIEYLWTPKWISDTWNSIGNSVNINSIGNSSNNNNYTMR